MLPGLSVAREDTSTVSYQALSEARTLGRAWPPVLLEIAARVNWLVKKEKCLQEIVTGLWTATRQATLVSKEGLWSPSTPGSSQRAWKWDGPYSLTWEPCPSLRGPWNGQHGVGLAAHPEAAPRPLS